MPTDQQILSDFGNKLVEAIRQKQIQKGIIASGKSAAELEIKATDKQLQVIDREGYFEFQEFGRRPGKRPPRESIKQWIELKLQGNIRSGISIDSLAFLIARKIGQQGTKTFRTNPTGVLSEVINEEAMQNLKSQIFKGKIDEIRTEIQRLWVSQ